MIGKYTLEIGTKEFLDGMTSSPETEDGGFSPQTSGINVISNATTTGVLYAPADITDKTGSLNGYIIASCEDSATTNTKQRIFVTSTGYVYYVDNTYAITNTVSDAGRTYSSTNTDIISYKNKIYVTSQTDIMLLTTVTTPYDTKDATWWSTTKAQGAMATFTKHPMVVYEDILWIADGNKLHKWDDSTLTNGFITLPTDQQIYAMAVDPSTGLLMISVSLGENANNNLPKNGRILYFDGYSSKVRRTVPVDSLVTAMYPMGGNMFMFYGRNFGYWTGSGVSFLRKLKRVTEDVHLLVTKHKITNIGNILYFADGFDIIAYGETTAGNKKFFIAKQVGEETTSYLRYAIFNCGNNYLGIGYGASSTAKFAVYDVTARTTGGFNFYSKKYKFPRPIYIREFHIEYLDQLAASGTTGVVTIYDQDFSTIAAPSLTNDSTSGVYSITRPINSNKKIRSLQLYYTNSSYTSTIAGIRRFTISYDVVE